MDPICLFDIFVRASGNDRVKLYLAFFFLPGSVQRIWPENKKGGGIDVSVGGFQHVCEFASYKYDGCNFVEAGGK